MASRQQPYYPDDRSHHLSPYNAQHQPEDFKASYDDLIDQHATPFEPTSRHQAFEIDTPSKGGFNHRPNPSVLHSNSSFTTETYTKGKFDGSDDTHPSYPPPPMLLPEKKRILDRLLPDSLACRLYIMTILIQTTIDLAVEGDLLIRFHEANKVGVVQELTYQKMSVYLSIFALAHVFQFALALDSVYNRNTLQFMLLTAFNALFLVYAIIQIFEIRAALPDSSTVPAGISHIPIDVLTTIIPVVISIAQLIYIGLGWKIYNEFGWKVYKFLGADRRMKKMYANYQIYDCLLKFDVFFWIGFSVQFIWLILNDDNWEFYVTCAALPLSVILIVEGHLGARHENKWMMGTFISGCVGAFIYFTYKLVKVLVEKDQVRFRSVFKSLATFSFISIVLLVVTFVFAVLVMRNFGHGLKDQLSKRKTHNRYKSTGLSAHHRNQSVHPNRMSIG